MRGTRTKSEPDALHTYAGTVRSKSAHAGKNRHLRAPFSVLQSVSPAAGVCSPAETCPHGNKFKKIVQVLPDFGIFCGLCGWFCPFRATKRAYVPSAENICPLPCPKRTAYCVSGLGGLPNLLSAQRNFPHHGSQIRNLPAAGTQSGGKLGKSMKIGYGETELGI